MLLISLIQMSTPITAIDDFGEENEYPPIADAGGPYISEECVTIEFDGSGSSDPEGAELAYRWDFENDGTWDTLFSEDPVCYFTWYDDFSGSVKLEVFDGDFTDTSTSTVTVLNREPVITNLIFPHSVLINEDVDMTVLFLDEDPRSGAASEDTFNVTIDWADGDISEIEVLEGIREATATNSYPSEGIYYGTVNVTDDDGGICISEFMILVVAEGNYVLFVGPDKNIYEGDYFISIGIVSPNIPTNSIVSIDWDDGFEEDVSINDDFSFNLGHQYVEDDGVYELTATLFILDESLFLEDTALITVMNCNPNITALDVSVEDPIEINIEITVNALFTDAGILDTHTAVIDWGDETSDDPADLNQLSGGGEINGRHMYAEAGVYMITVTVVDDDDGWDEKFYQYVVVYDPYDPDAGFVTGGGWIDSPKGAYVENENLSGKATFGFVSKYLKGQDKPSGNTEFNFNAGDLHFHSSSYDWLIVAGTKAMFKGDGQINNDGNYGFMLTAIDGGIVLGDGNDNDEDRFRIKIWDRTTDKLIYDNQIGAVDGEDPTTFLGSGSIIIHKR